MKILFVITRADTVGGAQIHVRDMAVALQKEAHEVLVLTGKKGPFNQVLSSVGIKSVCCETLVAPIKPFQDLRSLNFILKTARVFQPDLLSLHSSKTGVLGRVASRILNIPCTFTAHGWSFTEGIPEPKRSIYRTIEKISACLASKIICVSEHDRQIAVDVGISSDRLITIHNGINDIEPSQAENSAPSPSKSVKVVMVARFAPQKDHHTLLKALQKLDEVELILVGSDLGNHQMQTWLAELGLTSRVKLLGFRNDISEILKQADIFALISHWEGLPLAILEGMRAGLPVVASDVGGVNETIIDGETGYLIPRQDSETLADRLQQLSKNPLLRQQMGQAGHQKYQAEFSFEQMYNQTLAIYQTIN